MFVSDVFSGCRFFETGAFFSSFSAALFVLACELRLIASVTFHALEDFIIST